MSPHEIKTKKSNNVTFSVIIAYYKNPMALALILDALNGQSFKDFEIIIAEDDIKSELPFLDKYDDNLIIKHVHQLQDTGFTKNATLNKALLVADGKYIIFVDGDCIPHQHFIKAYNKWMTEDAICFGRRVMIGPKTTQHLYQNKDRSNLSWIKLLFSDSKRLKYGLYFPYFRQRRHHGIWGHNWCVAKVKLIEINGFDEDYQTAGVGEDVDIEWRLLSSGMTLYSIRYAAIQYHLHHNENYNDADVQKGMQQLKSKKNEGHIVCLNGLRKL